MKRASRSLAFYIVVSLLFAAVSYLGIQLVYNWELDRARLLVPGYEPGSVLLQMFTVHQVSLLAWVALAFWAAAAAYRFQSSQRESDRLLTLRRASTVLAEQIAPEAVPQEIVRRAVELLGAGSGSFYRWDNDARVLRCIHNSSPDQPDADARPGEGLAGQALTQMKPVVVNDYMSWEMATAEGKAVGVRAGLSVPILWNGTPLGVLVVASHGDSVQLSKGKSGSTVLGEPVPHSNGSPGGPSRFTEDDASLLATFGGQAAAALAASEAFERQREAMEDLKRQNKAKSDFVSIMSHEFRTPLTGIVGFSEMIRDEDISIEEAKEFATDINKAAKRLNEMIGEVLDLDRMESGRTTLNLKTMDLNAVITESANLVGSIAPNHPIILQLDDSIPALTADPERLGQVVTNLVNNAIKYSPGGGEILITTRLEGDVSHVQVRDHGMGIPAEALEQVFERYSRIQARHIQGAGLGLPIVRQIAEMHGGKAWAESAPGDGSIFHFTIPITRAQAAT